MQCSLCDKIALRVVGTGKRQKGFCKLHEPEAFIYLKKYAKSEDSKHNNTRVETIRNTFDINSVWR